MRRGHSGREHDADALSNEEACGGGEAAAKFGERSVDENEWGRGRIVAQANTRRRHAFGGRYGGFAIGFVLDNRTSDGLDLCSSNCAGAVDHHGRLRGIEDSGLETVAGGSGVEDGVDATVEIVEHVIGGCGTGVAEEVGTGRGDGQSGLPDERERDRMGRHAQTTSARPAVTSSEMVGLRGRSRVRGPGQKAFMRLCAVGEMEEASPSAMTTVETCTITGSHDGRSLAAKMRATASRSSAFAPSP